MKNAMVRNRRWLVFLVGALVIGTLAGLRWNRSHTLPPRRPLGDVASILVVSFGVSGSDVEPGAGAALAEGVRVALGGDSSMVIRRPQRGVPDAATPPVPEDSARDISQARRVGADYVLLGTVGRREQGSEIWLRLIRADDASNAWTGTFWRSSADLPSLAGDLAAAVSEAIHAERERAARERELQPRPAKRPLR